MIPAYEVGRRRLRHLLWHYERGDVLRERLVEALTIASNTNTDRFQRLSTSVGGVANLGVQEAGLATRVDELLRQTQVDIAFYEFSKAILDIEEAHRCVDEMEQAVHTRQVMDQAHEKLIFIRREINDDWQVVKQWAELLRDASALYEEGGYRAAEFVASLCLEQLERSLSAASQDDHAFRALQLRIGQQRELEQSLSTIPVSALPRIELTKQLATIEHQLKQRRLDFAVALLEELEATTDSAAAFRVELNRQISTVPVDLRGRESKRLIDNALVGTSTWHEATTALLGQSLGDIARRLPQQARPVRTQA